MGTKRGRMRGSGRSVWRLAIRLRFPFQPPTNSNNTNTALSIPRRLCATTATTAFRRNAFSSSPFRFSLGSCFSSSIFLDSPIPWLLISHSTGQRRSMFIQTQATPNPSSLMFYPDKPIMQVGSADFPNPRSAMNSPLAKSLFAIDGLSLPFLLSLFLFFFFLFSLRFYLFPPSLPCRRYSRFLWIRFRYRYEIGRRCLGIPETRSLCRYYGFLLFRSASLFGFSSCRRHGHRHSPSKHLSIIRESL